MGAAALAGCQESPYELVPVRGTVTVDGQPLSAGRVMFAPIAPGSGVDAGKPAFGTLGPDGTFTLSTYQDGDGAVGGEHWVTLFGPPQDAEASTAADLPEFDRFVVRQTQSVAAGQDNQVDIRLTSQELARFGRTDD